MKTISKCLMMAALMVTTSTLLVGCNQTTDKKSTEKEPELAVNNVKDTEAASPDEDGIPTVWKSLGSHFCAVSKKTEKYLVERVSNIYKDVCDTYNAAQNDLNFTEKLAEKDFDGNYCTDSWNDILKEVIEFDKVNSVGEIGFFEFDYWIMGQDFQDMSFHDVKVLDMHDNEATVGLILVNMDSDIKLKLNMKFERGDWYIDDIENQTMDFDMKKDMTEYLKDSKKVD